jgi:predicted nucleic acid-binding protein
VFSNYIFVVGADGHTLHIVPTDGRRQIDAELAPQLGPGGATATALAVSDHRELIVLDEGKARVLVFRINF